LQTPGVPVILYVLSRDAFLAAHVVRLIVKLVIFIGEILGLDR